MDVVDEAAVSTAEFAAPAGRIRKRRFSSARIQPTRIKKVMQSDEEIGRMVASVPVALGSAMEHFAEKLLESATRCVQFGTARTLTPSHIRYAVLKNRHFSFLDELTKEIPVHRLANEFDAQRSAGPSSTPSPLPSNSFPMASHSQLSPDLINSTVASQNSVQQHQLDVQPGPSQLPSSLSLLVVEPPVKRKRGRPRKERKDRFVDAVEVNPANGGSARPVYSEEAVDRALMPPPTLPVAGRTRRSFRAVSDVIEPSGGGGSSAANTPTKSMAAV